MNLSLFLPSIISQREGIALFLMLDQSGEVFTQYIRFIFGNVLSGFVFFLFFVFFLVSLNQPRFSFRKVSIGAKS